VRVGCARARADVAAMAGGTVARGRPALAIPADLTTAGGAQAVVDGAFATFGRVDILVNNVGGAPGPGGFANLADEHWQTAWDLNVLSAVGCGRARIPRIVERRVGRVINIASN